MASERLGPVALGLAAAALAGLAVGCGGFHRHSGLGTEIDREALRAEMPIPEALRSGQALPPIAIEVTVASAADGSGDGREGAPGEPAEGKPAPAAAGGAGEAEEAEEEEDDTVVAFDPAVVVDELVRLLEATGVFEKVILVGKDRDRADLHLAKDEAYRAGASFLVQVVLEDPSVRRIDRSLVLPMLVWATAGFPSLWLHNHTYRLESGVRLRLHDLNTGDILPERPLERAMAEDALNFHERTGTLGWYALTYFYPTPLMPPEGDRVARSLAAAAFRRPVGQFLERLAEALSGDVYLFETSADGDGPAIEVLYPPGGRRAVYLLAGRVRYALTVAARPGTDIVSVRLQEERVFPAVSPVGGALRRRVDVERPVPVAAGSVFVVEATDADGRTSTCRIRSYREAVRKTTEP